MTSPLFDQDAFVYVADDNDLDNSTFGTTNGNWSQDVDTVFRVRFVIQETNNKASTNQNLTLHFNLAGAGYTAVGAATAVQYASSSQAISDGDAITTQRLGGGTFVNGEYSEDAVSNTIDFSGNDESEVEYCLTIDSAQVTNGQTFLLQVYDTTSPINSYTNTPTVTVVEAAPDALTAVEITSGAPEFETPTLTHIHNLTAVELTSGAPEFETPTIAQKHALTAADA